MTTPIAAAKTRLDLALVDRKLVESRSKAQAVIMAGEVLVNGTPARNASEHVRAADTLALKAKPRFVSRGGEKLDRALNCFHVNVDGAVCVDLGASTGGFTDCLLQRGAARVFAIDVGHGQLDDRLRRHERVVSMERVNARHLESLPELADLVAIDVSFIGLKLILPVAWRLLRENGRCVPLIKPQFEAGKRQVGKGGVVKNPAVHRAVLLETLGNAQELGFSVQGLIPSPILGPAGNREFLALLEKSDESSLNIDQLVDEVVPR